MFFKHHNISMLCGQIFIFLQKNLLAYSWQPSTVCSPSLTSHWVKKKNPDSHSTFLWCVWIWQSWSCSVWKSIFSAYHFRNWSAQMVVHRVTRSTSSIKGPFKKCAYSFSINGLCISRTPTQTQKYKRWQDYQGREVCVRGVSPLQT